MGKSPQAYLGLYQTSMMMFFVAKLELIEQIGSKILKKVSWDLLEIDYSLFS